VVAVFRNHENKLLVCERSDVKGAWQFPQGGIEEGETSEQALSNEIKKKLEKNRFSIIRKGQKAVSYKFPDSLQTKITQKYLGQIQDWFLLAYEPGQQPNLSIADGEFSKETSTQTFLQH